MSEGAIRRPIAKWRERVSPPGSFKRAPKTIETASFGVRPSSGPLAGRCAFCNRGKAQLQGFKLSYSECIAPLQHEPRITAKTGMQ